MHSQANVATTAERIGAATKGARKHAGLKQSELSLVAGVSTRTVYAIEHAKTTVRLDALVAVLSALGLELVTVGRDDPRAGQP